MFLIIFIAIFFLLSTLLTRKHFRQLQLSGKIRGPPGLPLIGNGLELVNKSPIGESINLISNNLFDSELFQNLLKSLMVTLKIMESLFVFG